MTAAANNRRGMIALSIGMAAYAANDTCVKLVGRALPLGEIIFLRGLLSILLLLAAVWIAGLAGRLRASNRPQVWWRAVCDAIATACFIASLMHMNLAELSAIVLTSPLIITGVAALLYGEAVGWRRWCAILVGLAGAVLIVKPDPSAMEVWALLGLAAAVFSAGRDLMTRNIDPAIPTLSVSLYGSVAVTLTGAGIGLAESWTLPTAGQWLGIGIAAACLGLGVYLIVFAFRHVDISAVAPFRYTLLLWMGLSGYFVFGEVPDRWSLVGGALIAGGGLYALHREAMWRRELAARALPPA